VPTKAKLQEPAYSQVLNHNKIKRQEVMIQRVRQAGRKTVRQLWWMAFGVKMGRGYGMRINQERIC